jgi:Flp pilus assembly protein TadG
MKRWSNDSGQVLVVTSLSMLILLGIMGMALDAGMLFRAKRTVQIAADAAAVAAALDYKYNGTLDSAVSAGRAASAQNGITDGSGGTTVTINVPPKYGATAGESGYIEAVVQYPSPTYFMKLFGVNSVTIAGRAVVGTGATGACIWTLAKSGTDISLSGSAGLNSPKCAIYDDSAASNALSLSGSGTITARSIGIVGRYSDSSSGALTPTPTTGLAPAADPLAALAAPSIPTGSCSGSSCTVNYSGSGTYTVQPGTYTSISNSGSGTVSFASGNYLITGNVSNSQGNMVFGAGNYTIGGSLTDSGSASMTLGTGLYIVEGNLSLSGSGTITGNGVTFYTARSTSISGGSNLTLTAPTSGTYSGVLFFQSRSDSSSMSISGGSGSTIQGIIYAPMAALTISGSSGLTMSLDLIADSLTVSGSGTFTDSNYATVTNTSSVLGKTVMVE